MRITSQNLLAFVIVMSALTTGLLVSFSGHGGKSIPAVITSELEGELSKGNVAVMFWSETCQVCEEMRPYWERLQRAGVPGVKIMDVPLIPGKTDKIFLDYGVDETPTFMVLRDGAVVAKIVGGVRSSNITKYLENWIMESVKKVESVHAEEGEEKKFDYATLAVLPFLGAIIAFSPCSAPIVAAYAGFGRARRGKDYAICMGSSFMGTMALGSLFVIAASMVAGLIKGLTFALAIAAILFGFLTLFTASDSCPLPSKKVRNILSSGLPAACFSFGLVSLQCSLPLLAGYIALIGSTGDLVLGLAGMSLLAIGMASSLAATLYLAGKATGAFSKASKSPVLLERIGGSLLVILGLYLVLAG